MNTKRSGAGIPALLTLCLCAVILLSACGRSGRPAANADYVPEGTAAKAAGATSGTESVIAAMGAFPDIDLSGYAGLADVKTFAEYKDLTVADIAALKDAKETFVFLASFTDCPWCNAMIAGLNEAAVEAGVPVGILDTRKDPSWSNNLEIDDYDLFTEHFGSFLEEDEDGTPHLYVPHIFFIRNGEVIYEHQGALPEMGSDPGMKLTRDQKKALVDIYRRGFMAIR